MARADLRVGGKYKILEKLGRGSFGDLYYGVNVKTGEEVGIKMELLTVKNPQLPYEAKVYQHLQGNPGIPNIHWFGVESEYNVLIMALLGPNLNQLFQFCDKKFTLKTILILMIQSISRLEWIHSKNFLHRDIKPENILLGFGKK